MHVTETSIQEVKILEPKVFSDHRGFFLESYNARTFKDVVGENVAFVQDNHAHSNKHVLRGLHYQRMHPQGKLVRVVSGVVFDVAVDIRRASPTYGKWVGVELSEANQRQLWIPSGFAHGYVVCSQHADVVYKATDFYAPEHERCILWNDPTIGIQWPIKDDPIVSDKDAQGLPFVDAEVFI